MQYREGGGGEKVSLWKRFIGEVKDWGENVSELMIVKKKNNYKGLYTVRSCLGVFTFCTCCKILICLVCCVVSFKLSCV